MAKSDRQSGTELYRIGANETRRALIAELLRSDGETSVSELVDAIDRGAGQGTAREDRVEIELYHWHLPMLRRENCIEFDEDTGAVRPRDRLDRFEQLAIVDPN